MPLMMKCEVRIGGHVLNDLKRKVLLLKVFRIAESGEIVVLLKRLLAESNWGPRLTENQFQGKWSVIF